MKYILRRREFLISSLLGVLSLSAAPRALAAPPAAITDKDILKEGMPAPVAHYCENPTKQPNKVCPDAKDRPGSCGVCQFYTVPSETTFKGKKYAKCQLIPSAPNYVATSSWCSTFVKRAGA